MTESEMERFEGKYTPEPNSGCWLWYASINNGGYGYFKYRGRSRGAHVVSYEHSHGPIPTSLVIDHLCRVRCCVNPDHLEAVTFKENLRRGHNCNAAKTNCIRGHQYSGTNLILRNGERWCRECKRAEGREYHRKRRRLAL